MNKIISSFKLSKIILLRNINSFVKKENNDKID